jgi:hypothetical protein
MGSARRGQFCRAINTHVSIVGASPSYDIFLATQMLLDIRLYRLLPHTIVYAHFLPYAEKKSSNSTTHAMTFA